MLIRSELVPGFDGKYLNYLKILSCSIPSNSGQDGTKDSRCSSFGSGLPITYWIGQSDFLLSPKVTKLVNARASIIKKTGIVTRVTCMVTSTKLIMSPMSPILGQDEKRLLVTPDLRTHIHAIPDQWSFPYEGYIFLVTK